MPTYTNDDFDELIVFSNIKEIMTISSIIFFLSLISIIYVCTFQETLPLILIGIILPLSMKSLKIHRGSITVFSIKTFFRHKVINRAEIRKVNMDYWIKWGHVYENWFVEIYTTHGKRYFFRVYDEFNVQNYFKEKWSSCFTIKKIVLDSEAGHDE